MTFKYFSIKDTKEEAHRKYKALIHLYHPDKKTGDNAIMRDINIEYELITTGKMPKDDPVFTSDKKETTPNDLLNEKLVKDIIDIAGVFLGKTEKKRKDSLENLLKKYGINL